MGNADSKYTLGHKNGAYKVRVLNQVITQSVPMEAGENKSKSYKSKIGNTALNKTEKMTSTSNGETLVNLYWQQTGTGSLTAEARTVCSKSG